MATEKDLTKLQQQAQGQPPQQTTGGASALSAAPVGGGAVPPKAGSGGFVNLQRYMQANKGGEFGNKVANTISDQGASSKQAIGQAAEAFKAAAAKGTVAGQAGLGGQGMTAEQLQQQGQSFGENAIANAGNLGNSQVEQFQKLIGGQYAGPSQLQDVARLRAQAQSAQQLGNLASSQGGQQQLLTQLYGRPSYTAGQQRLDNLLLGGQQDKLKQARAQTLGLEKTVDLQAKGAAAQANALSAEDTKNQQALRGQLETEAQDLRHQAEQDQSGATYTLMDQWKNASKNTPWAAQSGESLGDWIQRTGGGPFAEQIRNGGPQFSIGQAADPAKQARLLALGRLGGSVQDLSKYTEGLNPALFQTSAQRAGDVEGYIKGVQSRQSIAAEEAAKAADVNEDARNIAKTKADQLAEQEAERRRLEEERAQPGSGN